MQNMKEIQCLSPVFYLVQQGIHEGAKGTHMLGGLPHLVVLEPLRLNLRLKASLVNNEDRQIGEGGGGPLARS